MLRKIICLNSGCLEIFGRYSIMKFKNYLPTPDYSFIRNDVNPKSRAFFLDLDCVHTMPAHFENDENCDGSKI